jgi:hypothetical protein
MNAYELAYGIESIAGAQPSEAHANWYREIANMLRSQAKQIEYLNLNIDGYMQRAIKAEIRVDKLKLKLKNKSKTKAYESEYLKNVKKAAEAGEQG